MILLLEIMILHSLEINSTLVCMFLQDFFEKAVKSTIFGVTQNFWFNGGGFIVRKGGSPGGPLDPALILDFVIKKSFW